VNIYLIVILAILAGEYLLSLIVEIKNLSHLRVEVPADFVGYYDTAQYEKSQRYLKDNTVFGLVTSGIYTTGLIIFILAGGFNYIDKLARALGFGPLLTGLIFAGLLLLLSQVIAVPSSVYKTFIIEHKYGFNRTKPKTFVTDIIKGLALTGLIGGTVLACVLWFFTKAGSLAWVYCWIAVVCFELFLLFIAPVVIMPLFNKFTPLEDGELKKAIEDYASGEKFKIKGISVMDGSRRSAKSNAFFTGFGRFRRIALFDTLIKQHTTDELVSVLAHEMGHYKKRHIYKGLALSTVTTGLMFLILSFFINNRGLFEAFKMDEVSVYASLFFFGFLYSPIQTLFSVVANIFSRRHEYEADRYAAQTYRRPQAMIEALKKLSVNNLSNLTPHPWKVFLDYSHPPVLERVRALGKEKL
jgi:STE24 endopeptidase